MILTSVVSINQPRRLVRSDTRILIVTIPHRLRTVIEFICRSNAALPVKKSYLLMTAGIRTIHVPDPHPYARIHN